MRHETILKREDGSQVKISVTLYINSTTEKPEYNISVTTRGKGKRNWLGCIDTDIWTYRQMNLQQREVFRMEQYLKHVTPAEIKAAKLEMWHKLKPE